MRKGWLDQIQVATPCEARWDEMIGDEQVRHCGECRKNVYNLSAMTRPAAEQLVSEHEGPICIRFYRREDGTVLTEDCPRGVAEHARVLGQIVVRAALFVFLMAGAWMAAISGRPRPPVPSLRDVFSSSTTLGAVASDVPLMTPKRPPAKQLMGMGTLKTFAKEP